VAVFFIGAYLASGGVDTVGDVQTVEGALSPTQTSSQRGTDGDRLSQASVPQVGSDTDPGVASGESPKLQPAPLLQPNEPRDLEIAPAPVGLTIDRIDVEAPVIPTGVDSATGQMEVPSNAQEVAWYRFGSSPGEAGSAVLAAHVDLASQGPGVFFELRTLEPGDVVTVDYDDGSAQRFVVEARTIYTKDALPLDTIFARTGTPVLTLITCGGGFNETAQNYDSNVVVYAVPDDVPSV
jgi:LPXTG-site transpeptidase (sortase) family protein